MTETTWDGLPIADNNPIGASIIVYREGKSGLELLILHRAHDGADYEGDWAWTPPSGARQPGEDIDQVASRELKEETGLRGEPKRTEHGNERWFVYEFRYRGDAPIILDQEHDRYEWVSLDEAICRCKSDRVSVQLEAFRRAREQPKK